MGNRYYPIDGRELASVTTITGLADKSGALIPWAVNCAVDYLQMNAGFYIASGGMNKAYIKPEIFDKARTEWRTVRDEAGDIGTQVHDALEAWLLGKPAEAQDTVSGSEQAMALLTSAIDKLRALGAYKVLATEHKVVNEAEWYAGRFDALLEVDGEIWLIDFKTGNSFYPEWGMQLAAYAEAWEIESAQKTTDNAIEDGNRVIMQLDDFQPVDRTLILRLDKKTLKAHWKEYGGEKDALTREQYWRAFCGLRDAFYILKAKKSAREAFINGY